MLYLFPKSCRIEPYSVKIVKMRKNGLYLVAYLAVVLFLLACTAASEIEKIEYICKSGSHLYVVTNEWNVKIYDLPNNNLIKVIKLPDSVSYKGRYASIKNVLEDNGDLFIQASASINNYYDKSYVYHLHGESIKQIGTLPPESDLVGVDSNYLYFIIKRTVEGEGGKLSSSVQGFRYDKQMKERFDHHFENFPDLVVGNIWEDRDDYWYACLSSLNLDDPPRISGELVLLLKSKKINEVNSFNLGQYQFFLDSLSLFSDNYAVWILGLDKTDVFDKKVVKFSKNNKTVEKDVEVGYATLFKGQESNVSDKYLWLISEQGIYRLNKDTMESLPFTFPDNITFPYNRAHRPIYSDNNNLWIAVENYKKNQRFGMPTEYVLKMSKTDADHQLIPIAASGRDFLKRIQEMTFSLIPVFKVSVVLLFILIAALSFLNVSGIKNMRARIITGCFSAGTLILIAVSSFMEAILLQMSLLVLIVMGVATVLISRALNYLVKPTRVKILSWILAIFFAISSCAIYWLLFSLIYRFPLGGESSWGLIMIVFYCGIIVGIISLFINMRTVFLTKK